MSSPRAYRLFCQKCRLIVFQAEEPRALNKRGFVRWLWHEVILGTFALILDGDPDYDKEYICEHCFMDSIGAPL